MRSNNLAGPKPMQKALPWQVWIIDDDPLTRAIICEALHNELGRKAVEITVIVNFKTALHTLARPHAVDLILLDNYLVDGEGINLLPHISEFSKASGIEQVPVMMVSANEDQSFLARCFSLGASDYVTKPFDVNLLGNKTRAMLLAKRNRDKIISQNAQLERLIAAREREEQMARFTYDFYLRKTHAISTGTWSHLETPNAFSGDLLLSAKSPEGRIFFMLVDATGHDLSAAITLIPVISDFQRMVEQGFRLSHLLHELNTRLLEDTPGDRFVAALVIELEPQSGLMHVWNGGMPAVLAVNQHGEQVAQFPSRHMSLGIVDDEEFDAQTQVHGLASGEFYVFFSDGLLEQTNAQGEHFGLMRLKQQLQNTPQSTLTAVVAAHQRFRGQVALDDDLSCCVIAPDLIIPKNRSPNEAPLAGALHSLIGRHAFAWHHLVCGEHIASTQIPLLCNGFLESMALGQELIERVFTIVTELFINAIDHGLLGLDSCIKDGPDGFFRYMQLRQERLQSLGNADQITVSISWQPQQSPPQLIIAVRDTGAGFTEPSKLNGAPLEQLFGRGLQLAANLASRVEIAPPGNCVTAILEGVSNNSVNGGAAANNGV